MITKRELRELSLDFRRISSNLLRSTNETASANIQRFKNFIDSNPFISNIVQKKISNIDYEYTSCFINENGGWNQIVVPVDEACHIKAMYDYMSTIVGNGSNVLGAALSYFHSAKKYDDIIQNFVDDAFKALIDFINDSITKEMMLLEEEKVTIPSITQNFNGTNYGTTNVGSVITSINNVTIGDNEKLFELLSKAISVVKSIDIDDDLREEVQDDLEVLSEQIQSDVPKKSRFKKALIGVKTFVEQLATKAIVSASVQAVDSFDWNELVNAVEVFFNNIQ
ncbi:MAG: hypothetical protein EOM28_06245 [Clostridia bacterium]|nr:hypothetical protein [Clostridia bacterium]